VANIIKLAAKARRLRVYISNKHSKLQRNIAATSRSGGISAHSRMFGGLLSSRVDRSHLRVLSA